MTLRDRDEGLAEQLDLWTSRTSFSKLRGLKSASRGPSVVPLPCPGELPDKHWNLLDDSVGFEFPTEPIQATHSEYARFTSAYFEYVGQCVGRFDGPHKTVAFCMKRATRVRDCCTKWRVQTCRCCGEETRRNPTERCEAWVCIVCRGWISRKRERKYARFFEANAPAEGHAYYSRTITTAKGLSLSLSSLKRQAIEIGDIGAAVFQKCGSKKATGFERAAAFLDIEVGALGNVHGHMVRYGPWIPSTRIVEVSRAVAPRSRYSRSRALWRGVPQTQDDARRGKAQCRRAARYGGKGSGRATSETEGNERVYEFIHPLVAVMFEVATHTGARRHRSYGAFRGSADCPSPHKPPDGFQTKPCDDCGGELSWDVAESERAALPSHWADENVFEAPPEASGFGRPLFARGAKP